LVEIFHIRKIIILLSRGLVISGRWVLGELRLYLARIRVDLNRIVEVLDLLLDFLSLQGVEIGIEVRFACQRRLILNKFSLIRHI
jgi:hypothetical protein